MKRPIRTAERQGFQRYCLLLAGAAAVAAGCDPDSPAGPDEQIETVQSALVPSECSPSSECADSVTPDYDWGRWPGGVIPYRFGSAYPADQTKLVDLAMADWTRASGGAVTFQKKTLSDPSTSYAPIVTIVSGGLGYGFRICSEFSGCDLSLDANNAYHEIQHLIGFPHSWQRNDTIHYVNLYEGAGVGTTFCGTGPWQRNSGTLSDFGPYDYFSTSAYGSPFPQITRWNGTPLISGITACGQLQEVPAVVCPPNDVSSIYCTTCGPGSSWLGSGDVACRLNRPEGMPTKGDGSAVAELYRNLSDPGWGKFARTTAYLSATSPTAHEVAPGQMLQLSASPAVTLQPGSPGTLKFFIMATNSTLGNQRVYMKSVSATGGTATWADLGAPGGTGPLTDPAAVSWSSSRIDAVVARTGTSSAVYIASSTNSGSTWTSWQSLGKPATANVLLGPAITSWASNRLDVVVRADDNKLYWNKCTANCSGAGGSWSGWTAIGGGELVRGKPAVVARTNGTFDVAVQNTSGQLRIMTNTSDSWSAWTTIDASTLPNGAVKFDSLCPGCNSPALGARDAATTDVYVRGQDDKVWLARCTSGSCTGFIALGGILRASPASVPKASTNGVGYLVIAMPEERDPNANWNDLWLKIYDARQSFPKQLAVGTNGDGRLEVLYNGVSDVMYRKWQPAWSTNVVTPRTDTARAAQRIAVARNTDGKLEVLYTDPSKNLRRARQLSPGSEFAANESVNGHLANELVAAENSNGTLQAVMTGTDNTLYEMHQASAGGNWDPRDLLNGSTAHKAKRLALARNENGRLETFYIGTNDVLYHTAQMSASSGTWDGQRLLLTGTTTAKRIAVVANEAGPPGRLEVVFIGTDDVLYRTVQSSANTDSWTSRTPLMTSTNKAKELTAAVNQDGRVEVFYIGMNDALYHTWQTTPGGTSWFTEQVLWDTGMTAKQLTAARNSDGRLELFFVGMNDVIYHIWQDAPNSSWAAPAAL